MTCDSQDICRASGGTQTDANTRRSSNRFEVEDVGLYADATRGKTYAGSGAGSAWDAGVSCSSAERCLR